MTPIWHERIEQLMARKPTQGCEWMFGMKPGEELLSYRVEQCCGVVDGGLPFGAMEAMSPVAFEAFCLGIEKQAIADCVKKHEAKEKIKEAVLDQISLDQVPPEIREMLKGASKVFIAKMSDITKKGGK